MKKSKLSRILLPALFLVAVAAAVVFLLPSITFSKDAATDRLVRETVPRLAAGAFALAVLLFTEFRPRPKWAVKNLGRKFLWCLPCIAVVFANFPYSALISGAAQITRPDLIWLFVLSCFAVGLLEETVFRGLLYPILRKRLKEGRAALPLAVVISSALFALMHLLNLAFGGGVGETFLQVGYSFLIGCMLAATYARTESLSICVVLHAIFDIGGGIVTELGTGAFQDTVFWILTAVTGAICLVHILLFLFYRKKQ